MMIWGKAAGNTTRARMPACDKPKLRPAHRNIEGTLRTPFIADTVIGKNDPRKMRNVADESPTPKNRMASGIHAIGLIGRIIWITGFTTCEAAGYQPRVRPNGIASTSA